MFCCMNAVVVVRSKYVKVVCQDIGYCRVGDRLELDPFSLILDVVHERTAYQLDH